MSHVKLLFKYLVTTSACRMPADLNRFVPVFYSLVFEPKGMITFVGETFLESGNKQI